MCLRDWLISPAGDSWSATGHAPPEPAHVMLTAVISASNPSPLWFATRGAGVVTQVLLTGVVILGIATSLRVEGKRTPRFVTAALHRTLSLFSIVLLAVHIATSVLDPFASIKTT